MQKSVIIVAGGSGKRMGSEIPKQFIELNKRPVLMRTIDKFYAYDAQIEIVVVLPMNLIPIWDRACLEYNFKIKHKVAIGGESRYHSVKSGLFAVTPGSLTAIHDGVRPLVSVETISRCFKVAEEKGNAIPAIQPTESVRAITGTGNRVLQREDVQLIQTPQVFVWEQLENAYEQEFTTEFTDDASVIESYGFRIHLVEGNRENIKITTPTDMIFAKLYFESESSSSE
ncbi:MAG: 2-C-methyl-D-erythritol 4-phosphate cytidylyltransferase [Bacteroidales bacterium]|nr:2-C-methyl-D-erythritol 4-phosphate cytidylyltransferase [Bacteroidales bacterium]MCF8389615.1 2-C-methyl-D-erythritol 4-phosphate cytidylyltransferase [Bacteroidales bacterium]